MFIGSCDDVMIGEYWSLMASYAIGITFLILFGKFYAKTYSNNNKMYKSE
jgi:hypothetical protein